MELAASGHVNHDHEFLWHAKPGDQPFQRLTQVSNSGLGGVAVTVGAHAWAQLCVDRIWPGMRIWAGGQWFYVTGTLRPAALAPEIDSEILVGFPAAEKYLHVNGHPSEIYVRTTPGSQAVTTQVDRLRRALGATRGQIRVQFLAEAVLLALAGGAAGVILGAVSTGIYAHAKGWAVVIPPRRGPAAWPQRWSSAAPPDCCPPFAPRGCPRHGRSGPSDTRGNYQEHKVMSGLENG